LDLSLALGAGHFVAVDALPDGSVLLLDSDPAERFSRVQRFAPGATPGTLIPAGPPASTSGAQMLVEDSKRATFRLLAHDMLAVHRDGQDVLYVASHEGDQVFAFEVTYDASSLTLTPIVEVLPMRLYGGRGLIAGPQAQPHYDSTDIWVPLTSLKRPRFAAMGTFTIDLLDGKTPDCVWHRLVLDAHVPPGCDIEVRSRARNDAGELSFSEWQREPNPKRRPFGSERPWADDVRRAGLDTLELLFQRATGRYLQLEITLLGTTRCSPRIRAIRVWYPRFSYLERYLPAVYRENAESASFLDRFLANPEGIFTEIEGRIAGAQALLDHRTAPPEALEWLASWFHVALDPAWDEKRRRLFIRHAAEFFEWRGTLPGLRMALRLASEHCANDGTFSVKARRTEAIRIIERFRSRPLPGAVFTETSAADGLPLRTTKVTWDPSLGAADLHRRWRELVGDDGAMFPIVAPAGAAARAQWSAFALEHLGFVPRAGDLESWRATLQRRYPTLDHLNRAWDTTHPTWDTVVLPTMLPVKAGALRDWIHFQSMVLPAQTTAHRFTVLLPQGTLGMKEREQRLDLIRRVVALEKPAHTAFEVKFYWAFFRLGEARLGEGTIVDLGSRSPELLGPFVVDRHYLGSGYLAHEHPPRTSRSCGCESSNRGEKQ
jgi:phage tail-like protein